MKFVGPKFVNFFACSRRGTRALSILRFRTCAPVFSRIYSHDFVNVSQQYYEYHFYLFIYSVLFVSSSFSFLCIYFSSVAL